MRKVVPLVLLTINILVWFSLPSLGNEQYRFDPAKRGVILVTKDKRTTQLLQLQSDGVAHIVFSTWNAIGASKTETPTGRFIVEAVILGARWFSPNGRVLGPGDKDYPLGSAVITLRGQSFALHGTNRLWLIRKKVSHGCVRNAQISALASMVVPGTIVYIQESGQAQLMLSDFDWQYASPP